MIQLDIEPRNDCHRHEVGFTLVELLTVLAIVGVLAGLSVVSVGGVRKRAASATCINNVRQQLLALQMYVDDNGYYPPYFLRASARYYGWFDFLHSSSALTIGSFNCPGNPRDLRLEKFPVPTGPGAFHTMVFSYGYNADGANARLQSFEFAGLGLHFAKGSSRKHRVEAREADVRNPSDMIAIADSTTDGSSDHIINPTDFTVNSAAGKVTVWPGRRHSGSANVGFCDAHVESVEQARVVEATNAARRRWNSDNEPHPEHW